MKRTVDMKEYGYLVEKHRQLIYDAEKYIWENPETGYREWKTHKYMAQVFESLGYDLNLAGNIPGFTAVADTGRPGPTVAVFGEMDALIVPEHPESDPQTGAVHSCGHCAQAAALIGIAAALKEPGALDGMCGKVVLVAVPAEEMIEIEYRSGLRKEGLIKYLGGKPEFLYRGLLDGVDLSFMVHTADGAPHTVFCNGGSNGLLAKTVSFGGVSAHAGGAPHRGINALYAANLALNAINALRETFKDNEHIRVHPIITNGGGSVNAIPDAVVLESYVRGATMDAVAKVNEKVNRAIAASAAAMGAKAHVTDIPGYWPRLNKADFADVFVQAGESCGVKVTYNGQSWSTASSDMGDISSIMPALHPHVSGATGTSHGTDYFITDVESACVDSAKIQYAVLRILLENGGETAKRIVADYQPTFASKEEYFAYVDRLNMDKDLVIYGDDGNVTLDFLNK